MAVTEEEAKTKWCPFVRYKFSALSGQAPFNRSSHKRDEELTRCIGSGCMAWRGSRKGHVEMTASDGYKWTQPNDTLPPDSPDRKWFNSTPVDDLGYCGLAGKP